MKQFNTKPGVNIDHDFPVMVLRKFEHWNTVANYIGVAANNIVTGTSSVLPLPPNPGLLNVDLSF